MAGVRNPNQTNDRTVMGRIIFDHKQPLKLLYHHGERGSSGAVGEAHIVMGDKHLRAHHGIWLRGRPGLA